MTSSNPFYISKKGGSITCFIGVSGRIFRSCSGTRCLYSSDLHSAKYYLDNLELTNTLLIANSTEPPVQRKTTLKWNIDGELSAVDMARILERLSNPELTQCELTRNFEMPNNSFQEPLPSSAWLP